MIGGGDAHDDAQAVTEHPTGRQPLELRTDEGAVDREQTRQFGRVDAGAIVADEAASVVASDIASPAIERVIDQFFDHRSADLAGLAAGLPAAGCADRRRVASRCARTGSAQQRLRRSRMRRIRTASGVGIVTLR